MIQAQPPPQITFGKDREDRFLPNIMMCNCRPRFQISSNSFRIFSEQFSNNKFCEFEDYGFVQVACITSPGAAFELIGGNTVRDHLATLALNHRMSKMFCKINAASKRYPRFLQIQSSVRGSDSYDLTCIVACCQKSGS